MKTIKSHSAGFTLIEAVITISIVSILASIAIPSFSAMVENNRISSASNDLLASLIYTRSEAAKRSQTVSICTSSNSTSCSTALNDYAKGWIIFTDCDEDGVLDTTVTTCDIDGDGVLDADKLLRVQEEIKNISMVSSLASGQDSFSYDLSGRGSSALSFNIGPDATTTKRKISIAITGRAKLSTVD